MAGSLKEEISPNPLTVSDHEMSFDSQQWSDGPSDQEMLSDSWAEDDSKEEARKGPHIASLKTYGERGASTVKVMFDNAEAEYDRTFKRYVFRPTFYSNQPFMIKTQTVMKNLYGQKRKYGTVFFEGKAAGPFRFLDLPAEIRVMIYELVLCAPPCKDGKWKNGRPIVGDSDDEGWDVGVDQDNAVTCRSVEGGVHHPELHIKSVRWQPRTKYPFQDGRMNLLSVSKRVSLEASDALYASTIFRFDDTNTLLGFLVLIGSNRQYLRRIRLIGQMAPTSAKPASQLLAEATQLQFLQIKFTQHGLWRFIEHGSRESVFQAFRPLFDMLFERDLDFDDTMTNQVVVRKQQCLCHERMNPPPGWVCISCKSQLSFEHHMVRRHFEGGLKHWQRHWGKRLELERKKAEAEAKRAQRQKNKPTKSKQASKNKKRSRREFDGDDEADTMDASVLSLPAPEPARKLPGRRAKSMGSYKAQLSDDEDASE